MILLLLTSIFAAAAAAPGSRHTTLPAPPVHVLDPANPESLRFSGVRSPHYDLGPLFNSEVVLHVPVHGASVEEYRIDFGAWKSAEQPTRAGYCPPGTWICLTKSSPPEHKEIPIADSASLISVYEDLSEDHASLTLNFLSNSSDAAEIGLICNAYAAIPPGFYGRSGERPLFLWASKYGCPAWPPPNSAGDSQLNILDAGSDNMPSDDTSDPAQSDDEGDALLDGKERSSRRSVAMIFLIISFVVISLSILTYRRPHRLNLLLDEHVIPLFQRLSRPLHSVAAHLPHVSLPAALKNPLKPAGEGRLVRWAEEDLELDAEADVMVNGGDEFDETDVTGDEYIPLRPSPRKGGRVVKNYGSAPASPFW